MYYEMNKDIEKLKLSLDFYDNMKNLNYRETLVQEEFFVDDFSFDILLFKIIIKSKLSDNQYELSYLENQYNNYKSANENANFTIGELFEQKWLINTLGEWHFNSMYKKFIESINIQNNSLKHIISFINELSSVHYKDERKIIINNLEAIIDEHKNFFCNTPDINWFEEKGLIVKDGEEWLFNKENKSLEPYLSYIFAKLWSQTILKFDSPIEKIQWWIEYYELFSGGYGFGKYLDRKNLNDFMKATAQWIIRDNQLGDWEDEERIAIRKILLDNPDYLKSNYCESIFPKNSIEKLIFIEDHYYNYYHYISDPRSRVDKLLSLYFYYYNLIDYEGFKEDLFNIIEKPFVVCKLLQGSNWSNSKLTIDLLLEKRTAIIGCIQLFNYNNSFESSPQVLEIWNQGFKILNYTLAFMDDSEKGNLTFDLGMYLIQKRLINIQVRNIIQGKSYLYYSEVYKAFIGMITENIKELESIFHPLLNKIDENIKKIEVPLVSKEFILLFDLLKIMKEKEEMVSSYVCLSEKGFALLYNIYIKSINYDGKDKYIFGSFKVSLIESKLWGNVIDNIDEDMNKLLLLIRPFSKDNYSISSEIQEERYKYCMLLKRKATIHLLFISSLIKNYRFKLDSLAMKMVIKVYKEYLSLFQSVSELDIFNINEMQLLESDYSLKVTLECLEYIDLENKQSIINSFKNIDLQKKIFMLKYIKNIDGNEKLKNLILENIDKINIDDIYYIPQIQEYIENLISSNNCELVQKAKILLEQYTSIVLGKGENLYRGKKKWIDSMLMRIALINKHYDEILNSSQMFYKGIVYIESDEHRDYQAAIRIYEDLLTQDPGIHVKQNLLCAYVMRIVELKAKNEDYSKLLEKAIDLIGKIQEVIICNEFEMYNKEIFYTNVLFLYLELDNKGEFWWHYNRMPDEVRNTKKCGLFIAMMLKKEGKYNKAKEIIEELYNIYGNDQDIMDFQNDIKKSPIMPVHSEFSFISEIQYYLNMLKALSLDELSEVLLNGRSIQNSTELILTKMVIDTCEKINTYSPNLIYNDSPSEEDRYSILFKEFFNFRFSSYFDFSMNDQSKIGFTGNTTTQNRVGLGENDLVIKYGDRVISIIEAVRLSSVNKQEIFEHVNKLFGYDIHYCNIMFVIVYGTSKNPKTLWDGYCDYLNNEFISESNKTNYQVYHNCKALDLDIFNKSYIKGWILDNWTYCTKHKNTKNGAEVLVVHIFIDVLKSQQQEIARKARDDN